MGTYLLTFHGGSTGATQEESDASTARWGEWFQDVGDAIVRATMSRRKPASATSGDVMRGMPEGDGAPAAVTGYTVITADDLDGAMEIAMSCPILEEGGNVEIGELLAKRSPEPPARTARLTRRLRRAAGFRDLTS